jgi:predicted RNA-binding protein with PIN domain
VSEAYLIDGYNLLHAMGAIGGRVGPHGLEKERGRLLGLLRGALHKQADRTTVVFDASQAAGEMKTRQQDGLKVVFATGKQTADDVIEDFISHASAPKTLQVVSDDHRIQKAARRRGCRAVACEDFLAWIARQRRRNVAEVTRLPDKTHKLGPKELSHWLKEFGDLESDPVLKGAFEHYDFEAEEGESNT